MKAFLLLIAFLMVAIGPKSSAAPLQIRLLSGKNAAVEDFIRDTLRSLPPAMSADLGVIELKFSKMDPYPEIVKTCDGDRSLSVSPVYGQYKDGKIVLNQNFLKAILDTRFNKVFPCGHKSVLALAKATLLHELTHAYDGNYQPTTAVKIFREKCRKTKKDRSKGDQPVMSWDCQMELSRRFRLSDDDRFRHLTGWTDRSSGSYKRRNQRMGRLTEYHEATSPQESLAVNAEYFMLDPEFKCRRPGLYRYLSEKLRHQPFPSQSCHALPLVFDDGVTIFDQWERLYEIQLLMADGGDSMSSRFGHVMFRLVICAPFRKEVSADCLADLSSHIVISPRGMIDGLSYSAFEGLTGGYDSRFTVLRFLNVLNEYGKMELRSLSAYPLKLSASQRKSLVEIIVETSWIYAGKFYFLKNNCAGESLSLLKALFDLPSLQKASSTFLTPQGLKDILVNENIADDKVIAANFFPSKELIYLQALREFQSEGLVSSGTLERFTSLSIAQKKDIVSRIQNLPKGQQTHLRANFLVLQDYAVTVFIQRMLQGLSGVQEEFERLGKEMHFEPWFPGMGLSRNEGYGVPQQAELESVKNYWEDLATKRNDFLNRLQENIRNISPDIARKFTKEKALLQAF